MGLELWLFAVALGTSMLGGVLGMASGIFIVPVLTMFGRIDIHTAIGASLVSVIACSCGSAAPFLKERLTNIRLAILLETATTSGALCGVLLAGWIPTHYLFLLFAMILLLSAQQMLARRKDRVDSSSVQRLPLGMTLMYGAGLISALLGIGSGVLKIPAMDSALRLPIKVSSATSNFMIGVTAAASAAAYFARGEIVTSVAAPVALGSVVGAGARRANTHEHGRPTTAADVRRHPPDPCAANAAGRFRHYAHRAKMKAAADLPDSLETLLGRLLQYGTLAASGLIGVGLALSIAWGTLGMGTATAGIALLILLPALRVATMLIFFLRAGDYRYGAIAALVLLIISISFYVGTR